MGGQLVEQTVVLLMSKGERGARFNLHSGNEKARYFRGPRRKRHSIRESVSVAAARTVT